MTTCRPYIRWSALVFKTGRSYFLSWQRAPLILLGWKPDEGWMVVSRLHPGWFYHYRGRCGGLSGWRVASTISNHTTLVPLRGAQVGGTERCGLSDQDHPPPLDGGGTSLHLWACDVSLISTRLSSGSHPDVTFGGGAYDLSNGAMWLHGFRGSTAPSVLWFSRAGEEACMISRPTRVHEWYVAAPL